MSYMITIKIDKPISREETKALFDSFPEWFEGPFHDNVQSWGFIYKLDVIYNEMEEPKAEVKLHGAYGTPFEAFLIETVQQLCKSGYKIVDLELDI